MLIIDWAPPAPRREWDEGAPSSQVNLTTLASVGRDERFPFDEPVSGDPEERSDQKTGDPEKQSCQENLRHAQPLLLR